MAFFATPTLRGRSAASHRAAIVSGYVVRIGRPLDTKIPGGNGSLIPWNSPDRRLRNRLSAGGQVGPSDADPDPGSGAGPSSFGGPPGGTASGAGSQGGGRDVSSGSDDVADSGPPLTLGSEVLERMAKLMALDDYRELLATDEDSRAGSGGAGPAAGAAAGTRGTNGKGTSGGSSGGSGADAAAAACDDSYLLLRGALLIARHRYPSYDEQKVHDMLDEMARRVEALLPAAAEERYPLRVVGAINRVMYYDYGFRGNEEDYYNADNSCINKVMERRAGIPITLSLVYSEVARRVGLPMRGVNLPGHFMLQPVRPPAGPRKRGSGSGGQDAAGGGNGAAGQPSPQTLPTAAAVAPVASRPHQAVQAVQGAAARGREQQTAETEAAEGGRSTTSDGDGSEAASTAAREEEGSSLGWAEEGKGRLAEAAEAEAAGDGGTGGLAAAAAAAAAAAGGGPGGVQDDADDEDEEEAGGPLEVLVDAFRSGEVCYPAEAEERISQLVGSPVRIDPRALQESRPLPPRLFLMRMLGNLRSIYLNTQQVDSLLVVLRFMRATLDPGGYGTTEAPTSSSSRDAGGSGGGGGGGSGPWSDPVTFLAAAASLARDEGLCYFALRRYPECIESLREFVRLAETGAFPLAEEEAQTVNVVMQEARRRMIQQQQ